VHFIYVIYSNSVDKYYVGETHNVQERLDLHNNGSFDKSFTKIAKDWHTVLEFECADRGEALFLERFIKRMKSRKFIERLILNPEILSDVLSKR
jgi:putative endonuclease